MFRVLRSINRNGVSQLQMTKSVYWTQRCKHMGEEDILSKAQENVSLLPKYDPSLNVWTSAFGLLDPSNLHHLAEEELDLIEEALCAPDEYGLKYAEVPTDVTLESLATFDHIPSELKSYLNVCINKGQLDKAHSTFIWHRKFLKPDADHSPIINTAMYNLMMKAWASGGQRGLNKVQKLFKLLDQAGIKPNLESYSFLILAHSLQENDPSIQTQLEKIMNEMKQNNLLIDNLFINSKLTTDQVSHIKGMFKRILPAIKFNEDVESYGKYSGSLFDNFNEQKGKSFTQIPFKTSDLKRWHLEQVNIEKLGSVSINSVFSNGEPLEDKDASLKSVWDKWEIEWRNCLKERLIDNLSIYRIKFSQFDGINIYTYLTTLEVNELVDIIINQVITLGSVNEFYSTPSIVLYQILGNTVHTRYITQVRLKHESYLDHNRLYLKYLNHLSSDPGGDKKDKHLNSRQFIMKKCTELKVSLNNDIRQMYWSQNVCLEVGKFLYNIMMQGLNIDLNCTDPMKEKNVQLVPILTSHYKMNELRNEEEEVRAHPFFLQIHKKVFANNMKFASSVLPMLSPPAPWLNPKSGGYLLMDTHFIRDNTGAASKFSSSNRDLYPVLDALNGLQQQPWIINEKILNVMTSVFNSKGDLKLNIPLHDSMLIQPKEAAVTGIDSEGKANEDMSTYSLMKKEKLKRERAEMYSLWCDCHYKLSIAAHLKNRVFWLPHNLDFRGRVYAVPPHLHHLGGDLSRGLLLFAEGRELGPSGLDWLKIHLINLTGIAKQSPISDRLELANSLMDEIVDSADYPLDGRKWWTQSDDPWQTLACCMEVVRASRSPDPSKCKSHFPIHQDGSCNGLQHYAALGRDLNGAKSVNLEPADRPQDVYTAVANIVERERARDAAQGVAVAIALEGFIKRKVLKQTVMTFVYGVTQFGARLQILKQLKDMDDFPKDQEWVASAYLMHTVIDSIQEMFTSTREIQKWLTDSSIIISKGLGCPVRWVTPIGLPVMQPYYTDPDVFSVDDPYYKGVSSFNPHPEDFYRGVPQVPNQLKQKNAFPPNFMHSLDSTHMMLTAINCEAKGINFVSVHDCYWTYPSSVDAMNVICREQFVKLHSCDILSNLSENFMIQYADHLRTIYKESPETYKKMVNTLSQVPRTGSFMLTNVLNSVYFFS